MGKSEVISEPSVTFARNVDWNLFKVFHEIARRGGIGAAARALNKKQPSITAALQRLEDQVGATLCTRTPRGVELTIYWASAPRCLRKPAGVGSKYSASDFRHQRGGFRHGDTARAVQPIQSQRVDRHL